MDQDTREHKGTNQGQQMQEDLHLSGNNRVNQPGLNPKPSPRWTALPLLDCL
jgi:hypothetical protein